MPKKIHACRARGRVIFKFGPTSRPNPERAGRRLSRRALVSTSQIGSTMAGRASVADVPNDIHDEYEVGETLGTGHFSKVKLGIHKITRERVAIKVPFDGVAGISP